MKKITLLFLCLFALFLSNEAYAQCTDFSGGGPYTDINTEFGGAPCDDGTGCPFNEITAFEAWADESYLLDNVILGNSYTFSLCNGPGSGTWPVSFTIIAPSGNIDASGTDVGSTCALTWTATEDGTYTIGISEAGIPCDTSANTATNNGYPAITCTDGAAPCTVFDCTSYAIPINESFDDALAFDSCYTLEDVDGDTLSWISQQDLDLDGDLINETFATNANGDPLNPMKDDWMFSPPIALAGGTDYTVTTKFNVFGGTPNASLEAFIVGAPSAASPAFATLFSNTGITTQGAFETLETMAYEEANTFQVATPGDYYIAYRSFGAGDSGFVLMFESNIDLALGVADFDANAFTHFYDNDLDTLTLNSSDFNLSHIEMFNILGQQVINTSLSKSNEVINMSNLEDGLYIAKVSIQGKTQTIKILKQ